MILILHGPMQEREQRPVPMLNTARVHPRYSHSLSLLNYFWLSSRRLRGFARVGRCRLGEEASLSPGPSSASYHFLYCFVLLKAEAEAKSA